ncbi:BZ3500_MvSof-1268-A1-R1_Chr5-1g07643 [Microbotryum saponariae]|uniref:BZ3500_MvSof-1268-A1-R1_Chr5-1g07643 protein n=1 Tax=Microbotryum saponariae TaxID=289078 RepID=A0A2X0LET9_9BASI|nr:BZ3500_MvSof-1268-A1-R1_Chr5-1g07643 [Microbotryum saponariae]SDA05514.1 BZ3501_MvSof-1269-A2-R1_Chr5-2g07467 [Microbotryum saponariae]
MSSDSSSDTQPDMSDPTTQPPSRSMPVATTSRVTLEHAASNEDAPTNKPTTATTATTATVPENLPSTTTKTPTSFAQLGVERFLCNALQAMSIRQPTEVQAACIPPILAGSDCIGSAQTGSGKTIAFTLPIMQDLAKDPHGFFALVLTPTRELAFQISEQFRVIGAAVNLHSAVIVGGMDMMAQAIELRKRPHVIIATPGRLVDLIRSNKDEWSLGKIKYLVLDEADRLLTPTFAPDLAFLVDQLPSQRQSLLFTATLTEPVMALQKRQTVPGKAPPFIHVSRNAITTPAGLVQRYLFIPSQVREVYLVYLLLNLCDLTGAQPVQASMDASTLNHKNRGGERPSKRTKRASSPSAEEALTPRLPQTILFVPHCRTAALFTSLLGHLPNPIPCTALHSHLSQPERLQSLSSFRRQQVPLLIATDVGSRGLDIPEVEVVLNWEVPRVPDDYVHRVGRTARAGRKGTSITVVTEGDVELVQALEERINTKLHELELPEEAVLELLSAVSMAKRMGNMELADGFGKRQETNRKKNAILQSNGAGAKANAGNKSLVGKHKRGKTVKAAVV